MFASNYATDQVAKGVDKFWFCSGDTAPEMYTDGPFDTQEEACAECVNRMVENGHDCGVVGEGEEIDIHTPDGDDVIERICCSVDDNYGSEIGDGYLDRHTVSKVQQDELTDAVEKAVAAWMTKHGLWPTFVAIQPKRELTKADLPAGATTGP